MMVYILYYWDLFRQHFWAPWWFWPQHTEDVQSRQVRTYRRMVKPPSNVDYLINHSATYIYLNSLFCPTGLLGWFPSFPRMELLWVSLARCERFHGILSFFEKRRAIWNCICSASHLGTSAPSGSSDLHRRVSCIAGAILVDDSGSNDATEGEFSVPFDKQQQWQHRHINIINIHINTLPVTTTITMTIVKY